MVRPLPFDGYSWQISQHEVCFDEKPLVGLLGTAALFEDRSDAVRELNETLREFSFVSDNIRNGVASPWRDYQQILPEMGLMVSSKVLKNITITDVGRALLSGSLPYSNMMSLQLMRYQYPNGYKSTTYHKFQSANVSIRPAVTLLRGLIDLFECGIGSINAQQVITSFLPNRSDSEWELSTAEIKQDLPFRDVNVTVKRNINAWLRLLGDTKFFNLEHGVLALSDEVKRNLKSTKKLADHLISLKTWHPNPGENPALSWFSYFGSFQTIDIELEKHIEYDEIGVEEIQNKLEVTNYTGKLSIDFIDFEEIDLSLGGMPKKTDLLFQSYLNGKAKLMFATQEHNKIVNSIAKYYLSKGYVVKHDPGSIDLLVTNPDNYSKIIEVKTTTQKTMSKQIRLGVGQILEYRFRYNLQNPPVSACDIVLNRPFMENDWHRDFCAENAINLNAFNGISFLYP